VTGLVEHVLNLPAWLVYLVAFGLVFAEDALFVGFVLPGETAAILAGVSASRGNADLRIAIFVVILAAILGDTVGYEVGRHGGQRLFDIKAMQRHQHRLQDANKFLARRGGWAVFLGRFTAFFRAVMPALAGTAGMHYRRFLAFNAAGGIVWGAGAVLLGYFAGNSYQAVEAYVGRGAAILAAVAVITLLVVWRVRRSRADQAAEDQYESERNPRTDEA
jgi:membrane protein DedA with SNARE-associated domain